MRDEMATELDAALVGSPHPCLLAVGVVCYAKGRIARHPCPSVVRQGNGTGPAEPQLNKRITYRRASTAARITTTATNIMPPRTTQLVHFARLRDRLSIVDASYPPRRSCVARPRSAWEVSDARGAKNGSQRRAGRQNRDIGARTHHQPAMVPGTCRGEMVGAAGFEPTTTSPPDWCATRLRHAPTNPQSSTGTAAAPVAMVTRQPTRLSDARSGYLSAAGDENRRILQELRGDHARISESCVSQKHVLSRALRRIRSGAYSGTAGRSSAASRRAIQRP